MALSKRRCASYVGAAALLVAVSAVGAAVLLGGRTDEPSADQTSPVGARADRWTDIAASPLAARNGAVGVWTGSEMLVAGGFTSPPCPPTADCVDPPGARSDGAAYDPEADSWRPIADAPTDFAGGRAVWVCPEMVVVTPTASLAYDVGSDAWRTLPPSPQPIDAPGPPPVVTDTGIVFPSYDQAPGREPTDLVLDPATGSWTSLPRDPFGESYDRSLAWDGERLWLLSMAVEQHFEAGSSGGATSRLAVLEGGLAAGTWRIVDDETPAITQGQVIWSSGDQFVVPATVRGSVVRVHGTSTGEWTETTVESGSDGCVLPRVGPGQDGIADGPLLTALDGRSDVPVPPCAALPDPDVAVWAGGALLLWGGPSEQYDGNSARGLVWAPAG